MPKSINYVKNFILNVKILRFPSDSILRTSKLNRIYATESLRMPCNRYKCLAINQNCLRLFYECVYCSHIYRSSLANVLPNAILSKFALIARNSETFGSICKHSETFGENFESLRKLGTCSKNSQGNHILMHSLHIRFICKVFVRRSYYL